MNTGAPLTFTKDERLSSLKIIGDLYEKPSVSVFLYPFRLGALFIPLGDENPAQVLISVSSRRFKHAHDRNRIKRQIREIYRHAKASFYEKLKDRQAAVLITYVAKDEVPFKKMKEQLQQALSKLAAE